MSEAQMRRISYLRSIVKDRDAEIERLRAALLTGVCMLSEMGLDPREKCQIAYDYLSAALDAQPAQPQEARDE